MLRTLLRTTGVIALVVVAGVFALTWRTGASTMATLSDSIAAIDSSVDSTVVLDRVDRGFLRSTAYTRVLSDTPGVPSLVLEHRFWHAPLGLGDVRTPFGATRFTTTLVGAPSSGGSPATLVSLIGADGASEHRLQLRRSVFDIEGVEYEVRPGEWTVGLDADGELTAAGEWNGAVIRTTDGALVIGPLTDTLSARSGGPIDYRAAGSRLSWRDLSGRGSIDAATPALSLSWQADGLDTLSRTSASIVFDTGVVTGVLALKNSRVELAASDVPAGAWVPAPPVDRISAAGPMRRAVDRLRTVTAPGAAFLLDVRARTPDMMARTKLRAEFVGDGGEGDGWSSIDTVGSLIDAMRVDAHVRAPAALLPDRIRSAVEALPGRVPAPPGILAVDLAVANGEARIGADMTPLTALVEVLGVLAPVPLEGIDSELREALVSNYSRRGAQPR